uniref:Saccharopine dehydrogenase NADP binding domain-containing protein n=1 Tax=Alexandrium andersonii TaxID=327968 RepID=A0A7S2D7P4_9DINO
MDFDDLDQQTGFRTYDIIVWGATGITGALITEHLDELCAAGKCDKKWAISGRNEEKLKKVKKNCKTNPDYILVREDHMEEDLDYIAEMCTCIIAAAGPYLMVGEKVVQACVNKSTHYVDVTGEIVFNRRVIDKHHEEAHEKGIMIVVMVGFMCALNDVNAYLCQQAVGKLKYSKEFIMCTAAVRGGGSFFSGFSQFEHMRTDEPPLLIDPYSLSSGPPPCGVRDVDKDAIEAYESDLFPGIWCSTGFTGHPGVRVARRAAELFRNSPDAETCDYGDEVVIKSCDCTFSKGQATMNAQMAKPPEDMRKIMSNAQAMEDGLMKGSGGRPGYGAPRETRRMSRSESFCAAEGENGEFAYAHFTGPEGYEFTSMAAVNGAICLCDEQDMIRASERGGVVTAAFAFHGSTWRDRLAEQTWGLHGGEVSKWEVVKEQLTEKVLKDRLTKIEAESKEFSKKMMTGEWATCELPELVTGRHLKG